MGADLRASILAEIDNLLSTFGQFLKRCPGDEKFSNIPDYEAVQFNTGTRALVSRVVGRNSDYANQLDVIDPRFPCENIRFSGGVLKALRMAVDSGNLVTVQELARADVFSDFIDMADYLLSEGYKDPAAVLIGGVLEEHLRKLCIKNGVDLEFTDKNGNTQRKNAATMNSDLAGKGVYSKLDQKGVTQWYELRNRAAHGEYNKYTQPQVELLAQSVRDFITRNPA